jgi:hypothetical protein
VRTILWVCLIVGFFSFGVLWLVGMVLYFAAPKEKRCASCQSTDLVPLHSPRGQDLQKQRIEAAASAAASGTSRTGTAF